MRLIDADELQKKVADVDMTDIFNPENEYSNAAIWAFTKMNIFQKILIAPTIYHVKYGHWIIKDAVTDDGHKTHRIRCSECNHIGLRGWIACPYCGADMREEVSDETD